MKKSGLAFLFFLLIGVGLVRADQSIAAVQQALKEQGFYYGDVTGTKTADTTAAIRRYQIRNGLQITGEIDAETLRSLGIGSGGGPSTARKSRSAPNEESSSPDEEVQSAEVSPSQPGSGYYAPGYGPGYSPANPPPGQMIAPRRGANDVFLGTPYEMAPPDLQRHVIVGVQTLLARYGFYHSGIDGDFGPGTEAAVRVFQSRSRLVADGRLNMGTLAALGLLPGQHAMGFPSRVRVWPGRPVYRGEWVPQP
jgi:peptidoglycan hydrolase-like protein with peptidoglycan-binding domain